MIDDRITLPTISDSALPGVRFTPEPLDGHARDSCAARLLLEPSLARWDVETKAGVCETGHYRLPYRIWGKGPALVIIPGLTEDARSFVLPMARLSADFCCISYDLPSGRGDGARLAGYRHDHLVDDLIALLDHLGIDRAYLLGCSLGSTIALAAMHQRPTRFPQAVLQGGFAHRPLAPAEVLLALWARYWPWKLKYLPGQAWIMKQENATYFADREAAVWQFFLEVNGDPPMAAVAYRALMLHRIDLRPILPDIKQPILLLCGDHDQLVGRGCERDLLRGLPNAARAEIENCGHMPHFTHPEVLSEIVRQYLLGQRDKGSCPNGNGACDADGEPPRESASLSRDARIA